MLIRRLLTLDSTPLPPTLNSNPSPQKPTRRRSATHVHLQPTCIPHCAPRCSTLPPTRTWSASSVSSAWSPRNPTCPSACPPTTWSGAHLVSVGTMGRCPGQGSESKVRCSGCTVYNAKYAAQGAKCAAQGAQCTMQSAKCVVHNAKCKVRSALLRVQSVGCKVCSAKCKVCRAQCKV
jgi:hypothetical protein